MDNDKYIKQVYDYTFTVISNLHMKKNAISQEEMYFLLSILDMAVRNSNNKLFNLLRQWQSSQPDEEIDAIVKATLLQLELNDSAALEQDLAIIEDLITYKSNCNSN